MRFPWISRTKHEALMEDCRNLVRQETARAAFIGTERDDARRLAKNAMQAHVDAHAAAKSAQKAAELWEERCHDANADVLAAKREECPACKAKDQTVALMADVVDFERARHMTATQPLPQATSALGGTKLEPIAAEAEDRKWVSDDEETVHHMLRTGQLGADLEEAAERASEMLARIGAANTVVTSAQ